LAFTDADCVVEPTWLRQLVAEHENPRWGGFLGAIKAYPPANLIERYSAQEWMMFNPSLLQKSPFQTYTMGERLCSRVLDYRSHIPLPTNLISPPTANVAYRRIVFEKIGYFGQRMTSGGDFDLAWRLQTQTDWHIAIVPNAVVYHQYRVSLADITSMYRRWGGAYTTLALKYGDDPERIAWQLMAESLLLMVLTVPSHLLRILVRPLGAINRKPDILFWSEPFLSLVCALHCHYSRLESARRWLSGRSREAQPAHNPYTAGK
jgi:cellulose synthase/poly-beta-1,6-N-acetylglucosamine synthase-like glycosyltransferase